MLKRVQQETILQWIYFKKMVLVRKCVGKVI